MPPRAPSNPYPWNGSWVLEVKRGSPIAAEAGVPQLYRFHLGPGDGPDVPIPGRSPNSVKSYKGEPKTVPCQSFEQSPRQVSPWPSAERAPQSFSTQCLRTEPWKAATNCCWWTMEPLGSASLGQRIARIPPRNSLMSKNCRPNCRQTQNQREVSQPNETTQVLPHYGVRRPGGG